MDPQTTLAITTDTSIIPPGADKHTRHRLHKFSTWMVAHDRPWHDPDLAAYRDALLADGKAPATVSAHLSTIRGRYAVIIADNTTRDALHILAGQRLHQLDQADIVGEHWPILGRLRVSFVELMLVVVSGSPQG
jgi:hypothetical protein